MKPRDMNRLFIAACYLVSDEARARYGYWADANPDPGSEASHSWFVRYSVARYKWCLADPEWEQAIMLAALKGGA